jgi:hypothetical protein
MSRSALSSFREKKGLSMDNERRNLKTTAPRHSHFSDDSHNLPDHRYGFKNKFLFLAEIFHTDAIGPIFLVGHSKIREKETGSEDYDASALK